MNLFHIKKYGKKGLYIEGHGEGTASIINAMALLVKEEGSTGMLSDTTVTLVNPKKGDAEKADKLLSKLQWRSAIPDNEKQKSMEVKVIRDKSIA